MHRKRTKFAARVHKVASSLERRGVVATYELHDRVLGNRGARRRYSHEPPALDSTQQGILDHLRADGYAVVPLEELLPGSWNGLEAAARAFIEETEAELAKERAGGDSSLRRREGKEFVVRKYAYDVRLRLDDPWLKLGLDQRLLGIANTYLGMWSKLEYVDVWYSVPQPADAQRISSQRWHRDYNDKHLLKVFLYLVDVDESMGPFQYVPGSQPGGPYAYVWPWQPLGQNYPTEEELEALIPASSVKAFTAPKGTLIFCNTAGFHRGGFSTTDPRVLATATYSSPASLASLTQRSYDYAGAFEELDAPIRYAIT